MESVYMLIQTYVDFLIFDIWVFSQWWLYAPLLIPFCFYMMFFIMKWTILTLPIWLPIVIVREASK